jgi:dipeptidyl aminopeptidase/acylaminoacyl peptidase
MRGVSSCLVGFATDPTKPRRRIRPPAAEGPAMDMELTAELLVDAPQVSDLHLSPDGQRVAYVVRIGQRSAVWVDGDRFSWGEGVDDHPRWSPDGRTLAFRSDRGGKAQIYLLPAAGGGEARQLTEEGGGVHAFAWSPLGDRIAFTSPDPRETPDPYVEGEDPPHHRLRQVDPATGAVTTLFAEPRHVAAFAWSPDGSEIAFVAQTSPEPEAAAHPCTVETTAGRTLARLPASPGALRWLPSGIFHTGTVAMAPCSSACLYRLSPWRRLAGGDEDCLIALCGEGPGDLAATFAQGLGTVVARVDPATGARTPIAACPQGAADIREASVVADRWAVIATFPERPPEVWVNGRPVARHGFRDIAWARPQPFAWRSPDGLALDGVLTLPPDSPRQPLPLVCLVHGGPYGRATLGVQPGPGPAGWSQWLAAAGYAVLQPNYRGGLGHGEAFAAAARGRVGLEDWQDVLTAVDTAIARGIADPARLGIGGWSQGGFLTAWAVTQTSRFRAAVVGAGVSDWGAMVATSDLPTFEAALAGSRPWDGSGPHPAARISPISFARAARTPTLILHGREDARVPVNQAVGFYRALRDAGCTAELVLYPREPHAFRERAHQLDVLRRVRTWYGRYLGA